MKDSPAYTFTFTVVLCSLCAVLLAYAHARWSPLITANEQFARTRALVDALGLLHPDMARRDIVAVSEARLIHTRRGDMEIVEGRHGDDLIGVAFDLYAQGKYGPIKGVMAVSADMQTIKALRIYQQNETPGLGGRIAEPEWLAGFEGVPLTTDGSPGIIISNTTAGPNVVDGITGASKTTFALGQAINTRIASLLSGGMQLEALDLGLTEDAVTRATPGYPRHLALPPHLREEVRRPDLMVPPGLINVAEGKPVTSSMDLEPIIGELSQVTDGIKRSGQFDYVELDPDPQWVQIDLLQPYTVHCIVIWHYYKNPVIYNDVIVQIADDPAFSENVRTLFNNDHDNSTGLGHGEDSAYFARWWGELIDTRGPARSGTLMRCIRVWTNGGCGGEETRFVEIQAFGK